jgi:hypothetical protein
MPQREVEERINRMDERNERMANARRGRRNVLVLERSQSVQEHKGQEDSQKKTFGRCESEPLRAKKTESGGPTIEELFPETTIRDATKYVGAIVRQTRGQEPRSSTKSLSKSSTR